MKELIDEAIKKGAKLYVNVSGGKDSQAMAKSLTVNGYKIAALIHADLGRTEWKESKTMCETLASDLNVPLKVFTRNDKKDMLDVWEDRLQELKGTGKPFWSSAANRYCTSGLKRDPATVLFTATKHNFIISCEGIRKEESTARGKKQPLQIRRNSSEYYLKMTPEQAIKKFNPKHKLFLTWYPIFNYTLEEVWQTYGMSNELLQKARSIYKATNQVPAFWKFHPAYAYGNERVSCMLCILGSIPDLMNGAKHNPELLQHMIDMEERGKATFKDGWSLKELLLLQKKEQLQIYKQASLF